MELSTIHQLIAMLIISSTICLSIATPSFEVHPIDVEVPEGGLAILMCTVTDLGDASLYWRYLNEDGSMGILSVNRNTDKYAPLHSELTERLSVKGDPNHGEYNLFIRNVIMSDQRQYFCSAITLEFYVFDSNKASLIVRPRNRPIPDEPDPLPACLAEVVDPPGIFNIGSLVRFTCATPSGSPPQTLAWTILEGGRRILLTACPQSPCIHNRQLSIEDVNRTFVCELVDGSAHLNEVECTYTPLERRVEVFIDPPLFQHPPGIRQGFICFPVAYDPNNLLFEWYLNSELIFNGTGYSLLNLMIHREDDGSTLSCVVSTLDGSFRGIGKANIELFDPSEVFPDVEGSLSPPTDHVTTKRAKTEVSSMYTTRLHTPSSSSTTSSSPTSTLAGVHSGSLTTAAESAAGAILVIVIVILLIIIFYKRRSDESAITKSKGKESDSSPQYENPVFDQSETVVHTYQDINAITHTYQDLNSDAQGYVIPNGPHTYQDLNTDDQGYDDIADPHTNQDFNDAQGYDDIADPHTYLDLNSDS